MKALDWMDEISRIIAKKTTKNEQTPWLFLSMYCYSYVDPKEIKKSEIHKHAATHYLIVPDTDDEDIIRLIIF